MAFYYAFRARSLSPHYRLARSSTYLELVKVDSRQNEPKAETITAPSIRMVTCLACLTTAAP